MDSSPTASSPGVIRITSTGDRTLVIVAGALQYDDYYDGTGSTTSQWITTNYSPEVFRPDWAPLPPLDLFWDLPHDTPPPLALNPLRSGSRWREWHMRRAPRKRLDRLRAAPVAPAKRGDHRA